MNGEVDELGFRVLTWLLTDLSWLPPKQPRARPLPNVGLLYCSQGLC